MATERLYFADAYLRTFTARVLQQGSYGDQPAVTLDRSAFYPEGGGQPGDRGTLNGVPVLDTQADAADDVWHVLAEPLTATDVQGEIDWARRFDFMQQHHGQHLLSAAAEQHFDATTLAVHLGEATCTVDLQYPGFTPEQVGELEARTNMMIWANVPVQARFVSPEELRELPLRKPPQAYSRIRIVSAGNFDHSPCGGTHPARTGEVGSVVIRRWERYKGGVRVEFVCGQRALRDYRRQNELLGLLAGELRVGQAELPAAVARLRASEEAQRKQLEQAVARLRGYEAHELIAGAERIAAVPIVVGAFADRTLDNLRQLARQIAELGGVALLGLRADKAQLVFTRGPQVPYDMGGLLREAAAVVGGRGGGKPDAAQGGGPDVGRLEEALAVALAGLRSMAGDRPGD